MSEPFTMRHLAEIEAIGERLVELGDIAVRDGYVSEATSLYFAAMRAATAGASAAQRLSNMLRAIADDAP